jgi:hypothetical protein
MLRAAETDNRVGPALLKQPDPWQPRRDPMVTKRSLDASILPRNFTPNPDILGVLVLTAERVARDTRTLAALLGSPRSATSSAVRAALRACHAGAVDLTLAVKHAREAFTHALRGAR